MDQNDLTNRFAYHKPSSNEVAHLYVNVRGGCLTLCHYLNELLPEGREKSLAITHLEEVMMWANAAIARNQ